MRVKSYLQTCILLAVVMSGFGFTAQAESLQTRHVFAAVANGHAQVQGHLPATQVLQLDVLLPLSDQKGLDEFVASLYDPRSRSYQQYMTPEEFSARFGPSQQDYEATVRYMETHGLTVVGGSLLAMDIQVKGPVSAIESAFHVQMLTYQHPTEKRIFYSPDREPSVDLPFALWHVSGMDNYSIPKPMLSSKQLVKLNANTPRPNTSYTGSVIGYFIGSDMRAAYYGGTQLTGAGQHLGLLEYYGTNLVDLYNYYSVVNAFTSPSQSLNVPISIFSTDGTPTSCDYASGCDDIEQTIDMQEAIGVAPGLASLVMYVGSTDTAMISAMTVRRPLPTTISSSWVWTPVDTSALNPLFERMAAQGQSFFNAAGDWGNWSPTNVSAWPAESDYVTAVGGTSLTTNGAAGPWLSESAWADGGSGASPDSIPIPYWQQYAGVINSGNGGSMVYRNGPDISANADFNYVACGDQSGCYGGYGGTSFAAPVWAGYVALLNQERAQFGKPGIGFLNPMIYWNNSQSIAHGRNFWYSYTFHDTTTGSIGSYNAVSGYDLVTGWGSPNGAGFFLYYMKK